MLAGSAGYLLEALRVGCVGGVCGLADAAPELVCQLYQSFHQQCALHELTRLQQRLVAPNTALTRTYGVAGLKQAMDWLGYSGGPTRSPLMPLTTDARDDLKKILVGANMLDA